MKWEFSSWGKIFMKKEKKVELFVLLLVPLVSKLCPNDTYKIYKSGKCVYIYIENKTFEIKDQMFVSIRLYSVSKVPIGNEAIERLFFHYSVMLFFY